ncbi:hypothetical protein IPG36_04730 [bacterium]|nr:MAG: hypothetical protein IPG36_04730 [bacterium]
MGLRLSLTSKKFLLVGMIAAAAIALYVGSNWLRGSGSGVPYQDAFAVQGNRVQGECTDCFYIESGARTYWLRATTSTRYDDSEQPFEIDKPMKAYVQDQQNADGSYSAIEIQHVR